MTDNPSAAAAEEPTANTNFAVLAAIADLADKATPAAIAQQVGIAYSTVNPKLRSWETAGLAERFRSDSGQSLWRLTAAGRASTATPAHFAATTASAAAGTVSEQATTTATVPPVGERPSAVTAAAGLHDGDDQDPAVAVPPDTAASDTPVPEPTTADLPRGDDVSGDAEPADAAASGTPQPITAPEPVPPAADEAAAPEAEHKAGVGTTTAVAAPTKCRRPKGALRTSALAVLQAAPDREFTVDDVKKEIDQIDAGTGYPRASHGAVSNALDTLEGDAAIEKVDDRKAATFRLTPATD